MTGNSKIVPRPGWEPPQPVTRPAKAIKAHLDRIGSMDCVLCEALGRRQASKTDVHHIREGQGMSQRASDFLTIPLCHEDCHQGPNGIHGDRALFRLAKVEELDLLAIVMEKLSGGGQAGDAVRAVEAKLDGAVNALKGLALVIADDANAATFQTLGQYRTALLQYIATTTWRETL